MSFALGNKAFSGSLIVFCTSTADGKACNAQSLLTTDKEKSFRSPGSSGNFKVTLLRFPYTALSVDKRNGESTGLPEVKETESLIIPHHLRPWPDWRSEQQYISSGSGLLTDFSYNGYKP